MAASVGMHIKYSGINPADKKHFLMGLHSFIAGYEFSGIVAKPGPESPFQVGDVVFGMNRPQHQQPPHLGAHQDFTIAEPQALFKLPQGMGLPEAAATVLVGQTVFDGLLNRLEFGFPAAGIQGSDPTDRSILIWGGASGFGMASIQIAKAMGFGSIFVTASPRNHDGLMGLGAAQCFDYSNPEVVRDIQSAAESTDSGDLSVVFDAVVAGADPLLPPAERPPFRESSPFLAKRCCVAKGSRTEYLKLISVLPVSEDPAYKHTMCWRHHGDKNFMGGAQSPEFPHRVRVAIDWLILHHRNCLRIPRLTIVKGAQAGIGAMERSAAGKVGFEKIVLERPL
ncbi:Trans-enoyl reductase fsdC [Colletotrichum aenigma]|uniref:Trans-enoyl reductase fsdC n=1 Tax=Colletotrichum aenigma TaxID=1215731 RepID=UPI0018733C1E|nr:Trans-enoyl reductase fsdC [Colletotrichum aenigma]KAF5506977.1 Trans-enoyl reductase fsdC [Colletotrichum aenigma]